MDDTQVADEFKLTAPVDNNSLLKPYRQSVLREAVLLLLNEGPANPYDLAKRIREEDRFADFREGRTEVRGMEISSMLSNMTTHRFGIPLLEPVPGFEHLERKQPYRLTSRGMRVVMANNFSSKFVVPSEPSPPAETVVETAPPPKLKITKANGSVAVWHSKYGGEVVVGDETEAKKPEAVDHPAHYGGEDNPYEAIKVIEEWGLSFNLGNTVKYLVRAGKKDPTKEIEDLRKARWCLDREISRLDPAPQLHKKLPLS